MTTENLERGREACHYYRSSPHSAGLAVFRLVLGISVLVLLASCFRDVDLLPLPEEEKLVIEGSIETGQTARVLITRSVPIFDRIYSTELLNLVVTNAEVHLHCGDQQEQLFLVKDEILPKIPVYRGSQLKGEVGKIYTLEVKIDNQAITATDTMTKAINIEKLWFSLEPGEDSLGYVNLSIADPPAENNYYRIWAKRVGQDSIFQEVNQDILNDFYFNGTSFSIPLMRKAGLLSRPDTSFFRRGETVVIKLAHLSPTFYEVINNAKYEASNMINPFAIHFEAFSNLEGEAIGGWGCYSTVLDTLVIE